MIRENQQPSDGEDSESLDTLPRDRGRSALASFHVSEQHLKHSVIMIVDDEPINVKVLQKYLKGEGYTEFVTTTDARQAMDLARHHRPAVILLDVMMPEIDGLTILQQLRLDDNLKLTPVIIITASDDKPTKTKALELGATDFLAKPVDPTDLLPRVRNALVVKAYQDHLENYSDHLEREVRERTEAIEASRTHVIHCLARAAEYRDDITGNHVIRVGLYAGVIARKLDLAEEDAEVLELAAQLHDVGKIAVPDAILHKAGKLTEDEYEVIKKHCKHGRDIILAVPEMPHAFGVDLQKWADSINHLDFPILTMASSIATTHHEWWDGTGYPIGWANERIPIEGRIVAVADVYDALCSERPYKPAFQPEQALSILSEGRDTQFDPKILDAFFCGYDRISEIQQHLPDRLVSIDAEEAQVRR